MRVVKLIAIVFVVAALGVVPAAADTECTSDADCSGGRTCYWSGPNDSSCTGVGTPLDCTECSANACTIPPAGVDNDWDGLPDRLEYELARRFFPQLWLREHAQDTDVFYGTTYENGIRRVPYRITDLPGDAFAPPVCDHARCVEFRVGLPYIYDFGDVTWSGFGGAHAGDSEFFAMILAADRPTSNALTDPTAWSLAAARVNHHTSHSYRYYEPTTVARQAFWVAEKKHATYFSQSQCNSGGVLGADDCRENEFEARGRILTENRLQNIGEPWRWLDSTIHYPFFNMLSYCASYDIASFSPFYQSDPFRDKFTEDLEWCTFLGWINTCA